MSLSWIPKGILEASHRLCFRFLWSGKKENQVTPWVNWKRIVVPKGLGGWGLKNIFLFSQALAAKGGWRLIKINSLWTQVIRQKYLAHESVEDWIRNNRKSHVGGSVIWKVVVKTFHILESNLVWNVGNGQNLKVGKDPWLGSAQQHLLPNHLIELLGHRGIHTLSHLAEPLNGEPWFQQWRRVSSLRS
jgi:hypothetical protein